MRKKMLPVILFVAILSCFGVASPGARAEGPPTRVVRMTLLGDSYSAGNGAGDYDTAEPGAYRSRNNWANHYRDWVEREGVHAPLTVLAHSGHVVQNVVDQQIKELPANSDIVMFTIGGNDGGFGAAVGECFALGARDSVGCRDAVLSFRDYIWDAGSNGLRERTMAVFKAIDEKLQGPGRDTKQMVLLGYPGLLLPNSDKYILRGCAVYHDDPREGCKVPLDYPAGSEILKAASEK